MSTPECDIQLIVVLSVVVQILLRNYIRDQQSVLNVVHHYFLLDIFEYYSRILL